MTNSIRLGRTKGVTMALFWYILAVSVIGSHATGEFSVLHSPDSLKFSGSSKTLESLLKEIFSACLGLSVEENSDWNGLSISDPFNTPEAVVEVYVDGVSSLGSSAASKAQTFPLTVDEYEPDTFDALRHRIKQRFTNGGNKLVNIRLSEPNDFSLYADVFGDIVPPKVPKQTLQHLKLTSEEDSLFLSELEALKALTDKIRNGVISADNIVDFYNFRFRSLHALSDFHGPNSLQTKEAKKLLGEALKQLSDAFVKAYDGSVLVTVVATDVAHTRRAVRSVPSARQSLADDEAAPEEAPAEPAPEPAPPAESGGGEGGNTHQDDAYTADYAAIFNIILWFGVVFTFTLVAIVYAIMDMDPGRDSIIYRMTSTRMKKDN